MDKTQTKQTIEIIQSLFNFLYTQENKKYIVNMKWFEENINIAIREQFCQNNILDLNLTGKIDVYHSIVSGITDLVINNDDAFGCLTTGQFINNRRIESQNIRTKNLEIVLPIYSRFGLVNAETINNQMLDKLNNHNQKQKTYAKQNNQ